MIRLSVSMFAVLAACGGDSSGFNPGVGDDPGTGTGTLSIEGNATAEPTIDNASDAASFTTEVSVRISRASGDVTDGVVELHSLTGTIALTFDPGEQRWRGVQNGYSEVYELDVTSGDDNVLGVRVDGPDIHTFTTPAKGATVDSTIPIDVKWDRDETADIARLQTREFDVEIADAGTYSLAAGTLRSKPDEVEEEEIELTRSQRITPAGAMAGSSWRVSIRNRIALVVQPAP
jgi:hypothetical protein